MVVINTREGVDEMVRTSVFLVNGESLLRVCRAVLTALEFSCHDEEAIEGEGEASRETRRR